MNRQKPLAIVDLDYFLNTFETLYLLYLKKLLLTFLYICFLLYKHGIKNLILLFK